MNGKLRNKWTKRLFPFFALVLLLLPWSTAYAVDDNAAASQELIRIEVAELPEAPSYTVFGRALGGVSNPQDLFYIDATDNPADMVATLYLINTQKLINYYSYLILHVGVYVERQGEWEKATGSDGKPLSDIIISLRNGQASFTLPGLAKYKVTIDSGGFYSPSVRNADPESLSPQFYLEVR
ncbi:MAG TPA: hypothetical protein G4O01_04105 [Dehalococcoidia bacterium]|jgi:hypothetical protein|nr:hypothetical protein [Dehalococcoidia bacterium]